MVEPMVGLAMGSCTTNAHGAARSDHRLLGEQGGLHAAFELGAALAVAMKSNVAT
jgi:hypothetical protein